MFHACSPNICAHPPIPGARYGYETSWNLAAPTDLAVRGSYLYVITQNRGPGADTVKARIEVFLTARPDPTPPPPGFVLPFTDLEDPTRICIVKGDSTFILVADRHEEMRINSRSGAVVTTRSWSVKRYHFTGGAPLGSFSLPDAWVEVNGLAADEDLNIYASDAVRDIVAKFDRNGELLKILSTRGTGDGHINQARGLDWNGAELLVADTGQDRVVFLDRVAEETATRRPVGTSPGPYHPQGPEDVSGDRGRNFVYIADTGRDRVLKYRLTGEFVDSVYSARGTYPRLGEPILMPRFVAVEDPLVFVSDPVHDRLVTFALVDTF
jgi:DNA-binding beta-propeller fold protein YncE